MLIKPLVVSVVKQRPVLGKLRTITKSAEMVDQLDTWFSLSLHLHNERYKFITHRDMVLPDRNKLKYH